MALRKPHKRMKMVGRRVFAYCMTVLPHPSLLDSGLRRNDETGRSNGCHLFSYQSLMPAAAGTPRYEKPELWFGTANWHGGFCHAPRRPQRGTSPSPREVFDRATFAHSAIDHRSTIRQVSPVESRQRG